MKHRKKRYTTVYRMKMSACDYQIAIAALNARRLELKAKGLDRTDVNLLLLKLIDAYES